MTRPSSTAETVNDRIKLPFTFDVDKMIAEVEAIGLNNFIYYNVLPLRSPAHMVDPSLPFPPPADDYADGSWTDWLDTPELKKSPYLTSIVDTFREHTKVTLVRVLRLQAGSIVAEHKDETLGLEIHKSVIRLTIPIIRDEGVDFFLGGEPVLMKPGECWYMQLTKPHKVVNNSSRDRINLTVDMIPNKWIRNIIYESQEA